MALLQNWQHMLHTVVYSCDPAKAYQKGLVEQTNAILDKVFTIARLLMQKDIYKAVANLNSMHRAVLNGRSSREACSQNLLKVS